MDAVGVTDATVLFGLPSTKNERAAGAYHIWFAEHSQHIYGRALDVRLHSRNEEAVRIAREMKRGGVGWYPRSGFFHIDTGPVRSWTLDGKGLDMLLSAQQWARSRNDRQRNQVSRPGLENGGRPFNTLINSGRPLPSRQMSAQPLASLKDSGKPLVKPDRN